MQARKAFINDLHINPLINKRDGPRRRLGHRWYSSRRKRLALICDRRLRNIACLQYNVAELLPMQQELLSALFSRNLVELGAKGIELDAELLSDVLAKPLG